MSSESDKVTSIISARNEAKDHLYIRNLYHRLLWTGLGVAGFAGAVLAGVRGYPSVAGGILGAAVIALHVASARAAEEMVSHFGFTAEEDSDGEVGDGSEAE